jgi:hypothetical protein
LPVVFRHKGYRFLLYSNEGSPREPIHVHVERDGLDAKFWLWPDVVVAYNDGFNARALRDLSEIVSNRRQHITNVWNEYFGTAE